MNVRLLGLALGLGLAMPVVAQAQMLQPGLWEMTSSNVKVDDQPMDVQSILGQLQGQMTPQQRAALEKNGINIALMDGSVRFAQQQISSETWWAACTPNGGEVLGTDW